MSGNQKGTLIRTVGGFGDVLLENGEELRCALRGRLKNKEKPLVGDRVEVFFSSSSEGVIERIFPRRNRMVRPPVANVDQVLAIVSANHPPPDWFLLNSQLLQAERCRVSPIVCVNKLDLSSPAELNRIKKELELLPYDIIYTVALTGEGVEELKDRFAENTSVLAGPSGAGKSTILNTIQPGLELKTGEVSEKLGKGKHTTRRVELFVLWNGGLVVDTPGFNKLKLFFEIDELKDADLKLKEWFPEFKDYDCGCKFTSCLHDTEPECAVRDAVEKGEISSFRYKHYLKFLEEIRLDQEKRMR